jgi:hypothetical protein
MHRSNASLAAAALAAALAIAPTARAGVEDVAEAMKILDQVNQITAGMSTLNVTLPAPTPIYDNSGAFLSPYRCDGTPTEWSNKAMSAGAGAAVGGMAAEKAAAAIPFVGGFFSKKAKDVGAKTGAMTAAGGAEFVKSTSNISFNTPQELAVYLQAKHAALDPDFAKRVAAAMSIYPELKTAYAPAVQAAADAAKNAAAAAPAAADPNAAAADPTANPTGACK